MKLLWVITAVGFIALGQASLPQNCSGVPVIDNSSLYRNANNQPQAVAFAANATIHAYIDTSQITAGSDLYNAIYQSLSANDTWRSQNGGGHIAIVSQYGVSSGSSLVQPSYVITGGNVSDGFQANTSFQANAGGQVLSATTAYSYDVIDANDSGTLSSTVQNPAGLQSHELIHPEGLGECTSSACLGTSVSYQNGNTLLTPSTCDAPVMARVQAGINSAGGNTGSGQGDGNGNNGCGDAQPNDSCTCDNQGNWECNCQGGAPSCQDGTEAVCYDYSWQCTSVSTCQGDAPTCSGGSQPTCVGDSWQCTGCSDVCDTACSNYDYCTCYQGDPGCGGGGECDPDGDVCDPDSCNYDEFECECGYAVRSDPDVDPNDVPAARPNVKPRPDCKLEFPAIHFVTDQQNISIV